MNHRVAILVVSGFLLFACEESDRDRRAPGALDNNLVQSSQYYIHFRLPKRFQMDPSSHQGEQKWWCKYDDPQTGISVEAMSYGYISDLDLLMTVPDWNDEDYAEKLDQDGRDVAKIISDDATCKNVEEYFLNSVLPGGCEKAEFEFFDRYIHRAPKKLTVFFFDTNSRNSHSGNCYEMMTFTCVERSLIDHETWVMKIVESAKPWLSRHQSENAS